MATVTVEQVVDKLYELKERRAALSAQMDQLKEAEERLKVWLLTTLNNIGLDKMGVTCSAGKVTVFKKEQKKVRVADWGEVLGYVKKNEAWDILYHQVSSTAVQEIMDRGEFVPGVDVFRELVVSVQKR